ncbi:F-box protein SKIP22-like [Cornus florida]|uniref:F-box protein SKIP22-like n=1 Tax=Cornus florida TaxID=4283 RepID=UPI00289DC218|nr:F-box protein SKIP22-like [Cornus florida]
MKLRLRSLETKETLKIEVLNSSSLQNLKDVILQRISSSSSSIHLSLNRKDSILGSSQDSLQSLGITSGDLIFYTLNPNGFSSETETLTPQSQAPQKPNSEHPQNSQKTPTTETHFQEEQGVNTENLGKEETLEFESGQAQIQPEEDKNSVVSGTEYMDVDDDGSVAEEGRSVPCFLRKVFGKEVVGDGGGYQLLVIAVHAVLLESGFVRVDPVSKLILDGFNPAEWPSSSFKMVISYTLPEIIDNVRSVETVVLKFVSLGKFLNIYGFPGSYQVYLDKERLVPFLNVVWANCGSFEELNGKDLYSDTYPEKEVFEFWKIIKDKIALPLLIDLCEKAGLAPPPCFMRLPTDLKLKILESLAGVDLAKAGCVCSELLYLSSNDDLWKQKFVEQFGNVEGSHGGSHWKEKFAKSCESRKRRKMGLKYFRRLPYPSLLPVRRDPNPLWVPRIIGGDYDLLPDVGIPQPGRAFPHFPALRKFRLHCDLRGLEPGSLNDP